MKPLRAWQTRSRRTILEHNKFLKVENHEVQLPDGQIIPDWAWVIIPDAAIVLAMTPEKQFLCFRQTKYALEGTVLAPVGGMLEPDEDPLQAAQRELREETGYEATDWLSLGCQVVDPNRGVGKVHLFLARGAHRVTEPHADDLEDQELIWLTQDELTAALQANAFQVLAWTAVVSLSLLYLAQET